MENKEKNYFIVAQKEDDSLDIDVQVINIADDIPEKLQELYDKIEKTKNVIASLTYSKDEDKKKYIGKLLTIAQVGLVAQQPEMAELAIERLKDEITIKEGGLIKNQYMRTLGIHALILLVLAVFIGIVIKGINEYAFGWAGAMAGVWLSFGIRKVTFNFNNLHIVEDDRLSTITKLLFMGLITIFVILLLKSRIIIIELGNINTSTIDTNIEGALLIGFICGLLENNLAQNIYSKAKDIMKL
ncbi:hypothetical protein [Vallitalea guaymasensis]|uniref:hypothetical protein n=1 Tax=Vallitalea guaymasensis TaxID=1185412 RepID=UPI00235207D0|nr:hypothetical protein [Vallitalea guaymasensis]